MSEGAPSPLRPAHQRASLAALPWALVALALVLRLAALDLRPAHSDEGVNGWFAERVVTEGYYRYDPDNYHGPLHYYLLAASQQALGRNLWALRLPTALLGAAAVWLAASCAPLLGRRVAWLAALFLAVSPALVLYARWAIHESELLFFSLLVFRGLCQWQLAPGPGALWPIALGATGALASKEVWVLHAAVLAVAWALCHAARRWLPAATSSPAAGLAALRRHRGSLLAVTAAALAALALLYSGFGQDPDGLRRFFVPYAVWTERAFAGAGHEKAWHYWLTLLARYEQPALLGLLAAPFAAWRAHPLLRLLALYGGGSLAAYSIVPYKTPWCILQLLWPLAFLAAWALAALAGRRPLPATLAAALLALVSIALAVRLSFWRYDDAREPYVYVQTYRHGLAPVELLLRAAAAEPALRQQPVHVVMDLSWPIPWLLGDFRRAGYWGRERLPPGDALALFVEDRHRGEVEPLLRRSYLVVPFTASPVHAPSRAYFDAARFAARLPADTPRFDPLTR